MPRPLSLALCGLIKTDIQNGLGIETLKSRHRISDRKARTMIKLYEETGEVYNTNKKKGTGRPLKLKQEHQEHLRQFLTDHPEAFLKDMCKFMYQEHGMELTESTLQRFCKRIGWKLLPKSKPRDQLGFWTRTLPRDEHDNVTAVRDTRPVKKRQAETRKKLSYATKKQLLEKTRKFVQEYMSQPRFDASHDYNHILRVVALSLEILRVEQNTFRKIYFDGLIVELVALMHDIDDHKYRQPASNETASYPSPPNTNEQAQLNPFDPFQPSSMNQHQSSSPNIDPNLELPAPVPLSVEVQLLQIGWPAPIALKVAAITPFISYTAETTNKVGFASALALYPELAVVQDADRLDAIGATGIGRAFTYGGAKGQEGGMTDTLKHVEEKLIKLEGMMKTPEGKRLSVVRAERLRTYGRWWLEEMRMVGMAGEGELGWTQSTSPWADQSTSGEDHGPPQEPGQTAPDPTLAGSRESLPGTNAHQQASVPNIDGTARETALDDPARQLIQAIAGST